MTAYREPLVNLGATQLCVGPRTEKQQSDTWHLQQLLHLLNFYGRTRFKVVLICDEQDRQILINTQFNHVTIASEPQLHERVHQKPQKKIFNVRNGWT